MKTIRNFDVAVDCTNMYDSMIQFYSYYYCIYSASNNVLLKVDSLLQKYKELKDKYVANRNSTKEKLTEYIEKDAGVKLTEFHNQLKTFRADLSKQHVVSCVCPSPYIFVNGFVDAFS